MLKWIVILVLGLALLSGASPWPHAVMVDGPGFAWDGGVFSGLLAVAGILLSLVVVGFTLFFVIGTALLIAVGLPALLVLGILALIFAPLLIPFLILFALVGIVIKGLTVCAA